MKILLSNDDGIYAEGINTLYSFLKEEHEVFVIAPDQERSGAGSSITTKKPLKIKKIKENFISVTGTPVDCVHLGIHEICPFKPDLLISGINYGANMAEDLLYSGTVGAAMEGREMSIPSMAVSAAAFKQPGSSKKNEPNFESASKVTLILIRKLQILDIDPKVTLNLNIPNSKFKDIKEIALTTLGSWGLRNPPYIEETASGKKKYWISHRSSVPENRENSDIGALSRGVVSLSPIGPNFLVKTESEKISSWLKEVTLDAKK
ncbi:MAG: 5'/3'-nucleotidase SurE [Gammaproteobacteria bacterium]|nr:MAG: 5'/3'-nucleotidase SurE [Gammaproteobacteria bacterium]